MLFKSAACVAALTILVAAAPPPASLATKPRAIIAKRMLDPSSLQMRNVRAVSATWKGVRQAIVCGEYNSKNRFGGYIGFKNFIYDPAQLKGVLSVEGDLKLDYFAESGRGDFDHDPEAAINAGAEPAALTVRYNELTEFAIAYLPACLSAKG